MDAFIEHEKNTNFQNLTGDHQSELIKAKIAFFSY